MFIKETDFENQNLITAIYELGGESAAEIGLFYKPDVRQVIAVAMSGAIRVFTYKENNEYVGYQLWFVGGDLFSSREKSISLNSVYIKPEFRHGSAFIRFLKFAIDEVKNEGFSRLSAVADTGSEFEKLLTKSLNLRCEYSGYRLG